jgi:large subunit ribosomal protein L15
MGIINVGVISTAFQAGDVVDLNALQQKGMIDGNVGRLKVLASGTLDKPLTIKAEAFSVQAIKMITLTGGHAVHLNGGK